MRKTALILILLFTAAGIISAGQKTIPDIKNNPDGTVSISSGGFSLNAVPAAPAQETDNPDKPLPERIKLLVNKLGSTVQQQDRLAARNKIIKIGKESVQYLNNFLNSDKRTYARIQIAGILGVFKDESSIEPLELAAGSQYIALRKAAVENIAKIGGAKAVGSLQKLKENTSDPETKKDIEDVLLKTNK